MTLSKKYSCPRIFFFLAIFLGNVAFFEKIVIWKNIRNLISHKKGYIHLRRQTSFSPQERLGPQKRFFAVFSESTAFFEKTQYIQYQICDTKGYDNFLARRSLFLKNVQMCPQNSFSLFFSKNTAFFEKIV